MKRLNYLLCFIILLFALTNFDSAQARRKRRLSKTSDEQIIKILKNNLDSTTIKSHKIDGNRYFSFITTTDSTKKTAYSGYIFITGDYAPLNGFSGPTSSAIVYDKNLKTIKRLFIVESKDSPDYVKRYFFKGMKEEKNSFFNQFKNSLQIKNSPQKLHTVTGATVTSKNIIRSYKKTIEKIEPLIKKIRLLKNTENISKNYTPQSK